jgi:mono/diheme cytochrome c family protein
MKKTLLYLITAVVVFTLAACSSNSQPQANDTLNPVPAEYAGKTNPLGTESTVAGAEVFKNNCEVCHGPQGHGDGPAGASLDPAPKNLPELSIIATDDYLFWRISTGKDGTSMVAWKGVLTEEQIWQVISFIHTLR